MRRLRTWLATAGLIAVLISIGTLLYAAATYTTNLTLTKMTRGTTEWDTVINANYDIIDSVIGDYRQKGFTSLSSWINNVYDEVHAARGTKPSLDARLDWALNEDGTLKGTASVSEWINSGHSATRVDSDTFRISGGDYTGTYTPGRRLNLYDGSNHYMTVVSSIYTSGNTNVDVDDTVPTTILRLDYSVLADNSAPRKITGDFEVTGTLKVAPQIFTARNYHGKIKAAGNISESYSIPMNAEAIITATVTGDVTLTASYIPSNDYAAGVVVILTADGTHTLNYDSDWKWSGARLTRITTAQVMVLTVMNYGATASTIIAAIQELGNGI